jgi:thioredoxin 1
MTNVVPELTNGEFDLFIKEGLVLIDFFAEWCMPCMMMGPIIEDLNEEFSEKVKFGKINIDDNSDLAQKYGVQSIPYFILFKDGKIIKEISGAITQQELGEKIKEHL